MQLAFILSMPGCPSWNGKWSGEGSLYCIVKKFGTARACRRAAEILSKGYYTYSWLDGWCAAIEVREVNPAEARRLKAKSRGFYGYEWMVETIILYDKPMADHQVREFLSLEKSNGRAFSSRASSTAKVPQGPVKDGPLPQDVAPGAAKGRSQE